MTEVPKTTAQWNKMVGIRMEPKLRYLAELAMDTKGFATLTDYIKWAVEESFKQVSLAPPHEAEYDENQNLIPMTSEEIEEARFNDQVKSIASLGNSLWSESEFSRIESLSGQARHRVSEQDYALLQYIHNRKDLRIPADNGRYTLNRPKIDGEWETIKAAFAKTQKAGSK